MNISDLEDMMTSDYKRDVTKALLLALPDIQVEEEIIPYLHSPIAFLNEPRCSAGPSEGMLFTDSSLMRRAVGLDLQDWDHRKLITAPFPEKYWGSNKTFITRSGLNTNPTRHQSERPVH